MVARFPGRKKSQRAMGNACVCLPPPSTPSNDPRSGEGKEASRKASLAALRPLNGADHPISSAPSRQGRTPLALPGGFALLLVSGLTSTCRWAPKFSFGFRCPRHGDCGFRVALHRPRPERAEGPRDAQEHGSERAAARGSDPGASPCALGLGCRQRPHAAPGRYPSASTHLVSRTPFSLGVGLLF